MFAKFHHLRVWQVIQNAVDILLHCLEIYGAAYLFYKALWVQVEVFFVTFELSGII